MQKRVSTISRGVIFDGRASVAVLDMCEMAKTVQRRHELSLPASKILGNVFTATAYLCSWLKSPKSTLTVNIGAVGDYGKISVSGDGAMRLRGFLENNEAEGTLAASVISVVRDDGDGLPFVGSVNAGSDDIAQLFSNYFRESEQRPTSIILETEYDGDTRSFLSGGVFIQPLPGAGADVLLLAQQHKQAVQDLLRAGDFQGILTHLNAENVETRDISFRCHCSRKKAENLLFSVGKVDAELLLKEQGVITVHCDYCNTDYEIDGKRLEELFQK